MFLYHVIFFLLKAFLYLFLLYVLIVVTGRVYIEPINSVCKCKRNLDSKIVLITGGNSGIGLETARDLARRGAKVVIACRDEKKAQNAIDDIAKTTGNSNVEFRYLDLFKPSCIREFADDFNSNFDRLDILINNAGHPGSFTKINENGVDRTMQVNYIGPFLLTNLLMDKLVASKPSRIVNVSSKLHCFAKFNVEDLDGVHTTIPILKYANSKLCNVLWAKALAMRLPEGVTANSLHPGLLRTNIFRTMGYIKRIMEITASLFKKPREGAQTVIHLCVAPELERCSGGYYAECKLQNFYRVAQDDELVHNVWEETMRLTKQC